MALSKLGRTCCTSPAAMWFWAVAFAVLYGVGLVARSTSPIFEPYGDTLLLASLAGACLVNFGRNRTLHCGITGPLFLIGAVVAAMVEADVWTFDLSVLWGVVLLGVAIAFVIEWRAVGASNTDASRPASH